MTKNTFKTKDHLAIQGETFHFYNINKLTGNKFKEISQLPFTLKILLENLLRFEDGKTVLEADVEAVAGWLNTKSSTHEIAYRPTRVLMQDFTGVPAIVDLAAMRDAMGKLGGDPEVINPLSPVDLVIDHSVQVDKFANPDAFEFNVKMEMHRNKERYQFLRWGQKAFENFTVVPPGTGICHQVNLEYLGKCVWQKEINGEKFAFPDTLVGTDSHTTMINGLGILGWGVGGIEAEAAMLGQPISMVIPEVIGFEMRGKLREGVTATDLVLTVTAMLRAKGVVGKFVEFYGEGLNHLPLADRATISNMSPEYGATCGFFPIDDETLRYMSLTGRSEEIIALTKAYCQAQGLWREPGMKSPVFTDSLQLDLSSVRPAVAGPKRPQDKVFVSDLPEAVESALSDINGSTNRASVNVSGENYHLSDGDVVIAAITSCTNTSNPSVLMAAGLVAKKAVELGMKRKPWVKSSLAPGSKVVTDYLAKAGLQTYLDTLGFDLVGYGCTTCIGNSGPLEEPIRKAIETNDLAVSAVLSGNRNFEGRVHPHVKLNWLASPPLVVAYALAGTARINLEKDPLGEDKQGKPVYLKDIWPTDKEVAEQVSIIKSDMFTKEYADVFTGDDEWRALPIGEGKTYAWSNDSTYVKNPPYFNGLTKEVPPVEDISGARILALLGDSVTTDHISPAGAIKFDSPAGKYLRENGVEQKDFNSYGSRRGNHEVMMRGTFANIRIRNEMVPGVEGGFTKYIPSGESLSIYDAAMKYKADNVPTMVIAGKEYGTGSSRDWAAKGPRLLGVKAVIAESYERIHRSNLIGMGILPLQFTKEDTRQTLNLTGNETISIKGLEKALKPGATIEVEITYQDGNTKTIQCLCRIDTSNELVYYQNDGILHYVLREKA